MKKALVIIMALTLSAAAYAASKGEDVFYAKCTMCHGSALSLNKQKTEKQWLSTINRMKQHGLNISSGESKAVAAFLAGGK